MGVKGVVLSDRTGETGSIVGVDGRGRSDRELLRFFRSLGVSWFEFS